MAAGFGIPVHLARTGARVGVLVRPPVTWPAGAKYVWHETRPHAVDKLIMVAERGRLPDPDTKLDRYVLIVERADELIGVPGFILDA